MQDHRPPTLRQRSRKEGKHGTARAPQRTDKAQTDQLDLPRKQPRKDCRRARKHRPQKKAQDPDGHGFPYNVRHQPGEELEGDATGDHEGYGEFVVDAVCWVYEEEAAESYAGPEAGADVADLRRVAVAVRY
ncbi:hypothetical protein ASPCAL13734 [Aspergillus calidoustus]|uniref:Uncharacterized protein n=1 Tax=Aspergillus calidoustus TaxID=454130 RepID=A0A0U5CIE0_ASPCI|nr:hypothetical protein ASPCAL13734 [Aspergillus calidoustus]